MAELNLKQITDKLNSQLQGDVRKLVFWYDENGEFAEDIDTLELDNAKVLHLEKDNQFYIKHFLECEDTTTHYVSCAMPIFTEGDVIGCVVSVGNMEGKTEHLGSDAEQKLIQTAAGFLGRQLEG